MMPFKEPLYITCEKCKYQSDMPQIGDLICEHWGHCPKCGCEEWRLSKRQFLKKLFDYVNFSKQVK